MRKMNKKGMAGDYAMFFVYIFIVFIIWGGLAAGIFSFFGEGYDFKEAEAEILINNVEVCLREKDFFSGEFNIYYSCGFNSNIDEEHMIYVKRASDDEEIIFGVRDYINQCEFAGGKENINFPECVKKTISVRGESFEVIVGSNQDSRGILSG